MSELDNLFDASPRPLQWDPFPHVVADGFLRPEVLAKLEAAFPGLDERDPERPSEYTLFWGDEGFDRLVAKEEAWRTLFDAINSQAFLDYAIRQFQPAFERCGCRLNVERATWVSYQEPRSAKEAHGALAPLEADQLYSRLDLHRAWTGYQRRIHLDHLRRFVTMLIYFDDQADIGMVGGELLLHRRRPELGLFQKAGGTQAPWFLSRVRHLWSPPITVEPRRNRMVMFPCTSQAWHSVPRIRATERPRTFLQIRLSAAEPVWG